MSTRRAALQAAATAATVAILATLAGCTRSHDQGPAGSGSAAAHAAIVVRGGGPDPDSLDPQKARGFEAQSIVRDLCEGLTTLDKNARVAPGVAATWGVSTDGKIYVFKLRREARWSNGDPVVAADFVAGLERLV
ncbi:MAG TPA: ABC transporter substrate-binding protein, partial [Steroidobacteraceae bacterium]